MKKLLGVIHMMIFLSFCVKAQYKFTEKTFFKNDLGMKLLLKGGGNITIMPVHNNKTEDGQSELQNKMAVTVGAFARAELYPIHTPYFGYSFIAEAGLGWLGAQSHMNMEFGHHIFLRYKPIKLTAAYFKGYRESIGKNDGEELSEYHESKYDNIERFFAGIEVAVSEQLWLKGSFISESYGLMSNNAMGFLFGIEKEFKYSINLEMLFGHSANGIRRSQPNADLSQEGIYVNFNVSKVIQFEKSYYAIGQALF